MGRVRYENVLHFSQVRAALGWRSEGKGSSSWQSYHIRSIRGHQRACKRVVQFRVQDLHFEMLAGNVIRTLQLLPEPE
jgi:hypothetical protein